MFLDESRDVFLQPLAVLKAELNPKNQTASEVAFLVMPPAWQLIHGTELT